MIEGWSRFEILGEADWSASVPACSLRSLFQEATETVALQSSPPSAGAAFRFHGVISSNDRSARTNEVEAPQRLEEAF